MTRMAQAGTTGIGEWVSTSYSWLCKAGWIWLLLVSRCFLADRSQLDAKHAESCRREVTWPLESRKVMESGPE